MHNDAKALAAIVKDRNANGARCGERVVELKPPPPLEEKPKEDTLVLDEQEDMSQWPAGSDADVPPEELPDLRPASTSSGSDDAVEDVSTLRARLRDTDARLRETDALLAIDTWHQGCRLGPGRAHAWPTKRRNFI